MTQRWDPLIEQAVLGTLPSRKRERLVEHLRSDDEAREHYDLAIEAMRCLEGRAIAQHELALVEDWLLDDLTPESVPANGWLERLFTRPVAVIGALAAAALAVVLAWPGRNSDPEFGIKGGGDAAFAIEVLCGTPSALTPAPEYGCSVRETLSFAYRVDPQSRPGGVLTLFAVDREGRPLYYAPTPADAQPIPVVPGPSRELPLSIALAVNHEPGRLRVFGLVTPRPITIAEIDEVAPQLVGFSSTAAWHSALPGTAIGQLCATPGVCDSAQTSFVLTKTDRR